MRGDPLLPNHYPRTRLCLPPVQSSVVRERGDPPITPLKLLKKHKTKAEYEAKEGTHEYPGKIIILLSGYDLDPQPQIFDTNETFTLDITNKEIFIHKDMLPELGEKEFMACMDVTDMEAMGAFMSNPEEIQWDKDNGCEYTVYGMEEMTE